MIRPGPPGGAGRYWLAQYAGCLAYVPLFGLLLPRRALVIDPAAAPRLLSLALLAGALTASLANIAAGRISDGWLARHGSRRWPIAAGALATGAALATIGLARGPGQLVGAVVIFQAALNLMLAPLGALLADHVAHARKGMMAALLSLGLPLAGLGTAALAWLFPADSPGAFALLGGAVIVGSLPLVVRWPFAPVRLAPHTADAGRSAVSPSVWHDLLLLGSARLLVQGSAAFVIGYLFLFLARRLGVAGASAMVNPLALAAAASVVVAVPLLGLWSDRSGRRREPMILAALACAPAVWALGTPLGLIAAYCLFQTALAGYLALDAALVAQVVGGHPARGRLLGYLNLANTLPSALVPGLVALATLGPAALDWPLSFAIAAASPIVAALLLGCLAGLGLRPS